MANERFIREEALLGPQAMERLRSSHVAVFGLGGVGSWAVEALVRGGIGTLTLVDFDTVGESNLNRQLFALDSTLGQPKALVAAARAMDINPELRVFPRVERYTAETRDALLSKEYDHIIDAIDIVTSKLDLIQSALEMGIPIVSCLGTGNRLRADGFRVSDIAETKDDPLARVMRKELRKRGILHTPVLWAPGETETPALTGELPPQGRRSIPGSVSWVPSAAGLMLAGHVIRSLCGLN
jgi:tRNA A37 threonylcarbamoyladenosine dehydratase